MNRRKLAAISNDKVVSFRFETVFYIFEPPQKLNKAK